MGDLTRKAILSNKPKMETLAVPEWGGNVYLSRMSVKERMEFHASLASGAEEEKDGKPVTKLDSAMVLVHAAHDSCGVKLFSPEDAVEIAELDAEIVDKVCLRWLEINGIAARSVEQAEKN